MAIIWVIDVETTGEQPPEAGVCEIAAVPVDSNSGKVLFVDRLCSFVNPGHPIPPECQGIHHISDHQVKKSPTLAELMKWPSFKMLRGAILAAHNVKFDYAFLAAYLQGDEQLICTYRCARHLYPDAPNYKNQTLRYFLKVEPPRIQLADMVPHRALYDAVVTAHILSFMLRDHLPNELLAYTVNPILLKKVHFGTHRGKEWAAVPKDYLGWILRNDFDMDVTHTAKYWRNYDQRAQDLVSVRVE